MKQTMISVSDDLAKGDAAAAAVRVAGALKAL
jgi:hypothetical protein